MDAVTYPNEQVAELINDSFVALRVPYDAKPISVDFNVTWTPTIIVLDKKGIEHHRTLGYLAPEEFIPSLLLGVAKAHFDLEEFDDAIALLDKIIHDFPRSDSAPEAVYHLGVARYKKTHDAKPLKEAYERLVREYSGSVWEKRAYPYTKL